MLRRLSRYTMVSLKGAVGAPFIENIKPSIIYGIELHWKNYSLGTLSEKDESLDNIELSIYMINA